MSASSQYHASAPQAEVFLQGFTFKFWKWPGMGWSLLRAVTSGWDVENVRKRLNICRVCEHVKKKPTVDHRGIAGEHLYCTLCECGEHSIAELSVKLGFNNVRCEKGHWGPAHVSTVKEGSTMLSQRQVQKWQQEHPQQAADHQRQALENWGEQHPERQADLERMMKRWREQFPERAAEYDRQVASKNNGTPRAPTDQPASIPDRVVRQTMTPMHPGLVRLTESRITEHDPTTIIPAESAQPPILSTRDSAEAP